MTDKNFKVKSGLNLPITSANILGTDSSGNITSVSTLPVSSGGTGQTTANNALNALLPSQTGKSGQVLGTDSSNTAWYPLYYQGIQNNGTTVTARTYINFTNATFTDDSGNSRTNITFPAPGAGSITYAMLTDEVKIVHVMGIY
jgi:hypothetical protein